MRMSEQEETVIENFCLLFALFQSTDTVSDNLLSRDQFLDRYIPYKRKEKYELYSFYSACKFR
jgi:hypothetical protein